MKHEKFIRAMDSVSMDLEQKERLRQELSDRIPKEGRYLTRRAPEGRDHRGLLAAMVTLVLLCGTLALSLGLGRGEAPVTTVAEDPLPEPYQALMEKYKAALQMEWDANTWAEMDISLLVRYDQEVGYALTDLNGDGVEELLFTNGSVIYDLYTLEGEEAKHILTGWERNAYGLTEEGLIVNAASNSAFQGEWNVFRLGEGGALEVVERLIFDARVDEVNPFFRLDPVTGETVPITQEEYAETERCYPQVPIANSPLLPQAEETEPPARDEMQPTCSSVLNLYTHALKEDWPEEEYTEKGLNPAVKYAPNPMYLLTDLDGEGYPELVIHDGEGCILDIVSVAGNGDTARILNRTRDGVLRLCQGNVLLREPVIPGESCWRYLGLKDGVLSMVQCVKRNDGWLLGTNEKNLAPVTEEEAMNVLQSHALLALEGTEILPAETPEKTEVNKTMEREEMIAKFRPVVERLEADHTGKAPLQFLLCNWDADHYQELLLGSEEKLHYVLQINADEVEIYQAPEETYFRSGFAMETVTREGDYEQHTYRIRESFYKDRFAAQLRRNLRDNTWTGRLTPEGAWEPMDTAQVKAIQDLFPRLQLEWQDLKDFEAENLPTHAGWRTGVQLSMDPAYLSVKEACIAAVEEGWMAEACREMGISPLTADCQDAGQIEFSIQDMDENRVPELRVSWKDMPLALYTLGGEDHRQVVSLFLAEAGKEYAINMFETIITLRDESVKDQVCYEFYQLQEDRLLLQERLICYASAEPTKTWFYEKSGETGEYIPGTTAQLILQSVED